MNTLQLYVTRSYRGFQHMMDINPQEDIKQQVIDVKPALECLTYDATEKDIFYLVRYLDQGVCIIILRTIPATPGDHLAAWIHIPNTIEVDADSLLSVVNKVTDIIANPRITTSEYNHLRELFSKEFPAMMTSASTVANNGSEYAHRMYNGDTGYQLADFFGNFRYQTSYLPYAGVLLVSQDLNVSASGPNLTDEPLDKMVRLFPPKMDLSGVRAEIFDRPFDRAFLVPLMSTVDIVWYDVKGKVASTQMLVREPNMRPTKPAVDHSVELSAPVSAPQPAINPKTVDVPLPKTPPEPVKVPAAAPNVPQPQPEKPKIVKPQVSEPTSLSKHHDKPQYVYNFEIPASDPDIPGLIKFEVHTRNILVDSPIEGYELTETLLEGPSRSNHLVYTPVCSVTHKALWAGIGALGGILLTLLAVWLFSDNSEPYIYEGEVIENVEGSVVTPAAPEVPADTVATASAATGQTQSAEQSQSVDTSLTEALKYLDANGVWSKADLDRYPDLQGLYEDMNSFNKKALVSTWGPKLAESRRFANIVTHARLGMHKNPRVKHPDQKTYNIGDDQTINITTYLNTIDP